MTQPAEADPPSPSRDWLFAAVGAALVAATVIAACGGLDLLAGRPLQFEADAIFHYALAKATIDDGWPWYAHRLGAPFECNLLSFGLNMPLEAGLLRLLAFTTDDCIALLNRAWLVLCGLAAVNGYAAFRLLGLSRVTSIVCGCLFATTPYVYYRCVSHFNLHVAFVPIPTAAAVLIVADQLQELPRRTWLGVCLACFTVGLGFIYYSFFTSIILVHALAIAWLTGRKGTLRRGFVCLGLVTAGTALAFVPVAVDWTMHGKPTDLTDRRPEQADLYGLRIRDLVLPTQLTPVPALRRIGQRAAQVPWPLPGESRFANLGMMGAIGFIISLWVLMGVGPPGERRLAVVVRAAAALMLGLVVLATVGGFGSIFNVFVTPTIRAYNRVMPLIEVLALAAFGSVLQRLASRWGNGFVAIALPSVVVAFGLIEQNTGWHMRDPAASFRTQRSNVEAFVNAIEREASPGAAVLMLPPTPFPNDGGQGRMRPYDHAKAYLFSNHLRWSWPVFGERQRSMLDGFNAGDEPHLVDRASAAGFTFVWLDTFADSAAATESMLQSAGCEFVRKDGDNRYRFYRLPNVDHDAR
jgi:hypothetical protein